MISIEIVAKFKVSAFLTLNVDIVGWK